MKLTLIENWRASWKFASVRLAAIFAIFSGALTGHPELLLGLIPYIPEGYGRTLVALAVSIIVFVIPTLTRITKKVEPTEPEVVSG